MGKPLKYFLIFAAIIISFWTIGRLTNALQVYSVPSIANYPTIKSGDHVFATNLIKPERFDFICYYSDSTESGRQIFTHRLCGIGGDKIEIIKGILFVNGNAADNELSLTHQYILTSNDLKKVEAFEKVDETYMYHISADSIVAFVSDKTIRDNSINARRQVLLEGFKDGYIIKKYNKYWNADNFGPVIVPETKYFVLGDNRLNSLDSRYIGFIDKSRLIGTIIGR